MKVSITSHRREERAVRGLVSHPDINNPVLYFSDFFFFCICILSTLTGFIGCKDGRTARIEQASYLRPTAKREEVTPRSRNLKLQVKQSPTATPQRHHYLPVCRIPSPARSWNGIGMDLGLT